MRNKTAFPIDIDTRKYMLAIKILNKDALPKVVAETLNRTADATTKQQIKNVKKDLTVRTKYTINSMQRKGHAINHARGKNVDRMFSRAGTFSPYLWMQEENFTKKGLSGPVAIPTLSTRVSKNIKKSIRKNTGLLRGRVQKVEQEQIGLLESRKGKAVRKDYMSELIKIKNYGCSETLNMMKLKLKERTFILTPLKNMAHSNSLKLNLSKSQSVY